VSSRAGLDEETSPCWSKGPPAPSALGDVVLLPCPELVPELLELVLLLLLLLLLLELRPSSSCSRIFLIWLTVSCKMAHLSGFTDSELTSAMLTEINSASSSM